MCNRVSNAGRRRPRGGAWLPWLFLACAGGSAEAEKEAKALSRISAAETTNALASFQVKAGFRVELAAAEPLVTAPVALAFDERGRLFVAEMRDYPEGREENPHLGRIRVLEDPDEEGVFQTSTVYADNLAWPSALACYGGGVFVGATPQIIYFKDSQGDGVADVVKVVFTGFGGRTNAPQARALLNSFNWGLDNRIHCGTAGLGGVVSVLSAAEIPAVALGDNDLAFDPRTLAIFLEAGPAQSGLSFDSQGRKFLCDFTRPLRRPMYEPRYLARNPFFPAPAELLEVVSPATGIFRFAGGQTSRGRRADFPPGRGREPPTNALTSAWLTAARGCVVYRGSAFPTNYFDNVFIADPEAHVIHRVVLREHGLETVAERPGDERQSEFLASRDELFQPMQIVNGPDGALYIADLRSGHDNGRIYRIVPEPFRRPRPPRLDRLSTYDLVALLAQANGWHCDTAARLLYERPEPGAVALLTNMLNKSRLPLARLRALHALEGLGALREAQVLKALKDSDERVREHAVQLAEQVAASARVSGALWQQLRALAADPSIRVRYQLALSLGELRLPGRGLVLAALLAGDLDSQWLRAAVLSSLGEGAGPFLAQLAGDARFQNTLAGQQFLGQLATMIGVRGRLADVTQALDLVDWTPVAAPPPYALLTGLGEGLHRTGSSLGLVDKQKRLQRFFDGALNTALNDRAPLPLRVEAVRLLGVSPSDYNDASDWLRVMLSPAEPYFLESAVLAALGRCLEPRVAADLIGVWPVLAPPLRNEAMLALLARSDRAGALLAALETGRINGAELSSTQLNLLRTHRDPAISQRALRLFGPVPLARPGVVQHFLPALRLSGAVSRGHDIFLARCAACHRLGGEGRAFGPGLAAARIQGKEATLTAILEPNRDVAADYATCLAETREGESLLGRETAKNDSTLTLLPPTGGPVVWLLADIQSRQTQSWSLMPEGLEQALTLQQMADLLDYVLATPDSNSRGNK